MVAAAAGGEHKRHIASELLKHSDSSNPVFGHNRARVLAAGRPLLVAAQEAHEVRTDLNFPWPPREDMIDRMVLRLARIDT